MAETKLRLTMKPPPMFPAWPPCLFVSDAPAVSLSRSLCLCLSRSLSLARSLCLSVALLILFSPVRSVVHPKAQICRILQDNLSCTNSKVHGAAVGQDRPSFPALVLPGLFISCRVQGSRSISHVRATLATGGAFHERQSSRWPSTILL